MTVSFEPIKLWGLGVLICIRANPPGSRVETYVYVSQFPCRSGRALSFPTEGWRLYIQWNLPAQGRLVQSRAELFSQRGSWPQDHVSQALLTAMLFSQLYYVTIEMFGMHKVFFFTALQTGLLVLNWSHYHRLAEARGPFHTRPPSSAPMTGRGIPTMSGCES